MTPEAALAQLQREARIGRAIVTLIRHKDFGRMKGAELRVYLALAVLTADGPGRHKRYAIGQEAGGMHPDSVRRTLARLESRGLVTQQHDQRPPLVALYPGTLSRSA